MGSLRVINNEEHFQSELLAAGTRLVIVDFTATWCGPCQRMAPVFQQLSHEYTSAVFLKVDVDRCQETAAAQGVSAMPTFIFYKNRIQVDRLQGADPKSLENKMMRHYGCDGDESGGCIDLSPFILTPQSECINANDDHPLINALIPGDDFLQSNSDARLIISFAFNRRVKVHTLKIKGPVDKGPKNVKIFVDQATTLDFDTAENLTCVQELELTPNDIEGNPVTLRNVKFQNVNNLQLFVKGNQSGGDITQIDQITVIGTPINTINVGDFERVACCDRGEIDNEIQ